MEKIPSDAKNFISASVNTNIACYWQECVLKGKFKYSSLPPFFPFSLPSSFPFLLPSFLSSLPFFLPPFLSSPSLPSSFFPPSFPSLLPSLLPSSLHPSPLFFFFLPCGGLNEDAPHRLTYLSARSPVDRSVWEGLIACSCWTRCVTGVRLGGFKSPCLCLKL